MSEADGLDVRDLSVRLGGRVVLQDVAMTLPRRLVALVGPNGAGKTTLLRAMAGLIPFTGRVLTDGADVAALTRAARARRFAYLPQGHIVHWPLPVRDVVALGRYPHGATDPARLAPADEQAVARAMQATDVAGLAGRSVTALSGGERSRVALARVLAVESPVIFADEPIASLDPRYQLDVMQLLRDAADRGALVVVVTHDLGLAARFADHVVVLANGRLVAQGSPSAVFDDGILAEVFKVSAYRASHDGKTVIVPWAGV